jgi:hypothetical protein
VDAAQGRSHKPLEQDAKRTEEDGMDWFDEPAIHDARKRGTVHPRAL